MMQSFWAAVVVVAAGAAMSAQSVPDAQGQMKKYPAASMQKDVVETAVAAGSFTTLASALEAAGLVETLKGDGPFTVFAPTDAAFDKLPDGTLDDLMKPENREKLRRVLTYHVVSGKVDSSSVAQMKTAKTVSGEAVRISAKDGVVMINNAKVAKADIQASNGIIHVIDTVLLPRAES